MPDGGASAFIPKHGNVDQLVQGLSALANGGVYFPATCSAKVSRHRQHVGAGTGEIRLTRRQSEVLPLIMQGHSNQRISDELGISLETVKLHVSGNLLKLYKVTSRVQLILACQAQTQSA